MTIVNEPLPVPRVPELSEVDRFGPPAERLCAELARRLGVDSVGVVARACTDTSAVIAASDGVALLMEELQSTLSEGPALDAFRSRHPLFVSDLRSRVATDRWPAFARPAVGAGVAALFVIPLQVGSAPFGTVSGYRSRPGSFTELEAATALLLVDDFARAVSGRSSDDLPTADYSHGDLPLASAIVSLQFGISMAQAVAYLRAAALTERSSVDRAARRVVDRDRLPG